MTWHPDPADLLRLARDEPTAVDLERIRTHLGKCPKCDKRYRGLRHHFEEKRRHTKIKSRWKL